MIPFLDVKAATDELREPLGEAVARVVDSGWPRLGGRASNRSSRAIAGHSTPWALPSASTRSTLLCWP